MSAFQLRVMSSALLLLSLTMITISAEAYSYLPDTYLAEDVHHLNRYPSRHEAKRLIANGVENLVISSSKDDEGPLGQVEYPATSHVKTLNFLESSSKMNISVQILSSAYPSRANTVDINILNENVELSIEIQNCLSTQGQTQRLKRINRVTDVIIVCEGTQEQYKKATLLMAEIALEKENLSLTLKHQK